jgi:hypothetical protein
MTRMFLRGVCAASILFSLVRLQHRASMLPLLCIAVVGHLLLCGCEAVNRIDSNTGPLQLRLATDSASPVNVPDGYTADSEADLVTKLPGYDASKNIDLDFGLYAG